jgi:hypothetical protein
VLEEEIVPTLERQIPNQPTEAELEADPYRMRFRLVFDREGYNVFMKVQAVPQSSAACLLVRKIRVDVTTSMPAKTSTMEIRSRLATTSMRVTPR